MCRRSVKLSWSLRVRLRLRVYVVHRTTSLVFKSVGDVLEAACCAAVRMEDVQVFEQNYKQLRTFYHDNVVASSPRQDVLTGLYLMWCVRVWPLVVRAIRATAACARAVCWSTSA